jgi:hypothetical protein
VRGYPRMDGIVWFGTASSLFLSWLGCVKAEAGTHVLVSRSCSAGKHALAGKTYPTFGISLIGHRMSCICVMRTTGVVCSVTVRAIRVVLKLCGSVNRVLSLLHDVPGSLTGRMPGL